jgi:CRP-like cAMP-binding protein
MKTSLLETHLKSYNILTHEEVEILLNAFSISSPNKDEVILRAHQRANNLYFIEKGTLRTYTETEEKEVTTWIYPDGMFITSWYSFLDRVDSFEYIQSLEESTLFSISYDKLHELYRKHTNIERFGRLLVEQQLSFLDYYSRGYQFLSAKERYDLLLSFFPDITLRAKLGHIASMLGITKETISRIRAQK